MAVKLLSQMLQKEELIQLGIAEVDVAVVRVGDKIDTNILITLFLKEMKAKKNMVKSITEDPGKINDLENIVKIE